MITQKKLREIFNYINGELLIPSGKSCSSLHGNGYIYIRIKGVAYKRSRLVWMYHNGDIGESMVIDHINRDKTDDRLENLRVCTHSENMQNTCVRSDSSTGITGVHFDGWSKKWRAYISLDKKKVWIGRTTDFFEACCMRKSAEIKLHSFRPL